MPLTVEENRSGFLSGTTLKLIACIAMFIDHLGLVVFPKKMIFRIIGRLAFPMFAYFIAEGCKYTRNKLKHFLVIFSAGVIYFLFYLFAYKRVYLSIFLTFSVSILIVYLIDVLKKYAFSPRNESSACFSGKNTDLAQESDESPRASEALGENSDEIGEESSRSEGLNVICEAAPSVELCEDAPRVKIKRLVLAIFVLGAALAVSYIPFKLVLFDYGYLGMLAPVLISLCDFSKIRVPKKIEFLDSRYVRLLLLSSVCIALTLTSSHMTVVIYDLTVNVQIFNLFAIPLLALYNGKVGIKKLKYFFYAFYPVHLGVIMGIKMLVDKLFS